MAVDPYTRRGAVHRRPGRLRFRRGQDAADVGPATSAGEPVAPQRRDTTTRHLCAGAHRSAAFADEIIAEALVEPLRAVPPCPGADAAAVLRDAVAARTRRRLRDALLLVLLGVFAILHPVTTLLWSIVAYLAARRLRATEDDGLVRRWNLGAPVLALVVAGGFLPAVSLLDGWWLGIGGAVPAALLAAAMLVTILADEVIVLVVVRYLFAPDRFVADGRGAGGRAERAVRGLGERRFAEALARVSAAGEPVDGIADVIVHRGYHSFVGAGTALRPITIVRPLKPAADRDGSDVRPVLASALHDAAAGAVLALAATRSLSSGEGMGRLQHREQVVVQAERLVAHRGARPGPELLPEDDSPPVRYLPRDSARHLADRPVEWARYYGCFSVESWDGELATSSHFYATADDRMIYLVLSHCVLLPIRQYFRDIDYTTPLGYGMWCRSARGFLALPCSVVHRLRNVLGRFPRRRYRVRDRDPARFGAARSVREIAAGETYTYDNQKADADQYLHLITVTVLRAVTDHLAECGYDIDEFEKAAMAAVVNNTVTVSGGTHIGGQYVAGSSAGSSVVTTAPPDPAADQ